MSAFEARAAVARTKRRELPRRPRPAYHPAVYDCAHDTLVLPCPFCQSIVATIREELGVLPLVDLRKRALAAGVDAAAFDATRDGTTNQPQSLHLAIQCLPSLLPPESSYNHEAQARTIRRLRL